MKKKDHFKNCVGFAIGTGRCGTKFIAQAIGMELGVSSSHERNILNESFHRYCKWYELPVDNDGFLHTKQLEIQKDLENNLFSFESSAQLSSSIQELYNRFEAKFLLIVRSPERVVNSFIRKGNYNEPFICSNPKLALGYQDCNEFHHFLGRIAPTGEYFFKWNQMTQFGKLAWYWNAVNSKIVEQFDKIPESNWRIEKIEALVYNRYIELARFFGFDSKISKQDYDKLVESRPNALINVPTIAAWSATAIAEFESEVAPMADRCGYEYKVERLAMHGTKPKVGKASHSNPFWFKSILNDFEQLWRRIIKG